MINKMVLGALLQKPFGIYGELVIYNLEGWDLPAFFLYWEGETPSFF